MCYNHQTMIVLVPLTDIPSDPPVDLSALPEAEAVAQIKQIYGYWGSLIDVRIEHGMAVLELPEEQSNKAGAALDKIAQAAKAARAGRYQQAITLYQDALKTLPLHTAARRELAMAQMEVGHHAAAKQNLIRVLQLDPKDSWAYLILGNLYFRSEHDLGSAERYYAAAVDLAPDDAYILNAYASLLWERKRYDEAKALYARTVAAKPDFPNGYMGLALIAAHQGDDDGALLALEQLFDLPAEADVRSAPLYTEARRRYAELRKRRADRVEAEAHRQLQAAMDAYTARTGIEIRVQQGAKLDVAATVQFAWRYGRTYHAILYATGGGVSYLIAHEFAHILLDERLRQSAANRLFRVNTGESALRLLEKDLRKLRAHTRLPSDGMDEHAQRIIRDLANQLYNMPLDLFIERGVHADFPALRDAQFAGLAKQMAENAQIIGAPQARELIPGRALQASLAMSAAFALFVDDLYGGRTAYADAYGAAGALPAGRKLYNLFRKMAGDKRPAVEYELVDAWAGELNLRDLYTWVADDGHQTVTPTVDAGTDDDEAAGEADAVAGAGHRTAQQTIAMHDGGPTNPDYLSSPEVQMAVIFHMLAALQRFSKLAPDQIQKIAFEIAVLGMDGINYIAGEEQYTLKTLPGEQFSGLQLLCLQYAGFQLTHPEIDTQIPLGDAYRMAKGMFDAGMGG
jgi:Tfp pilus assembly protein PilF